MKKWNIVLIAVLLVFITGCDVEYNVNINRDLSVEESFTAVTDNNSLIDRKIYNTNELIESVLSSTSADTKEYLIKEYLLDNSSGAKVSRKYSSLAKYVGTLNEYDLFPNKTEYSLNSNILTFKTTVDKLYKSEEYVLLTYDITSKVNIKIPFEVTYHNADSVDLKTNTYTWNVNNTEENKEQTIMFTADTSKKKYDFTEIIKVLSVIAVLVAIIVIVSVGLKIKSGKRNKI